MSDQPANPPIPPIRTGQAVWPMSRQEFAARFRARFADPAFSDTRTAIDELMEIAWDGYREARKSPITRKAGAEFADPNYDMSVDWLGEYATSHHALDHDQALHDEVLHDPRPK